VHQHIGSLMGEEGNRGGRVLVDGEVCGVVASWGVGLQEGMGRERGEDEAKVRRAG